MLLVTNPLICNTRQVILEWDFSSTNEAARVEVTKAPYGLGLFMINFLENCHGRTKTEVFMTSSLGTLVYLVGPQGIPHQVHLPDGRDQREYSHWSHIYKKMKRKTSSSFYLEDPQQSLFKQMMVW